jgi:rhomboid protease GluP
MDSRGPVKEVTGSDGHANELWSHAPNLAILPKGQFILVEAHQLPPRPQSKRITLRAMLGTARQAPLTSTAVLACFIIFLGISSEPNRTSWAAFAHWGVLPPNAIYDGGYWVLVSSVFVHADAWHLAANLCCLWLLGSCLEPVLLGSCLERVVGVWRWMGFFVVSAFASSALELIVTDETGIGASGVVYAMAGFMWIARNQYPQFKHALTKRTMVLFLIWLVAGFFLTAIQLVNIANTAHVAGLLVGVMVALHSMAWSKGQMLHTSILRAGIALLIAASVLPLFYAPWSISWLSNQAYHAHSVQHYTEALSYYDQIIELNPQDAWAFVNRSRVYQAIGATAKANADSVLQW